MLIQQIRARPRLSIAIMTGIATASLAPFSYSFITRLLLSWNATVWSYLLLMGMLMANATHSKVRMIAEQEDKGALAILIIMSVASMASLAAIIFNLAAGKNLPVSSRMIHYAFTGLTVLGSWFLLAILFTFHYARTYYRSPIERRALKFPDNEENLTYWDFLYFSFTIAVAVQTSDVSIMSRSMRKTVLAQAILSFLFNVAIIGLSINITASLIGS